jgi:serine/threonine-protein kinase
MELVEGTDLKRFLAQRGAPPPAQAYEIAIQVADGLQAIHDVGIVHRDLKTPNLMLDGSGVVKLMDFGIAKRSAVDATAATATGLVVGTPDYMSPEQARGMKVDARSDIYAFGIVVFELFTGELPFRDETPVATILRHISEPPPLDGPRAARIPQVLRPVLAKALAKDPEHRYASVREMGEALVEARDADTETASLRAVVGSAGGPALAQADMSTVVIAKPSTAAADMPTLVVASMPTVAIPSEGLAPTVQLSAAELSPQPVPVAAPPSRSRFPVVAIAGGTVALLVVGGLFLSRSPTPVAPASPVPAPSSVSATAGLTADLPVTLNALPWARVKLRPLRPSVTLPELTEEERTTPCVLRLPEAEYEVELENGGITPLLRDRIAVRAGQANDFVFRMPDFDPGQAASRAERPER